LRDFVRRQIAAIKAALRVYSIQGTRPLREAMAAVAGDLMLRGKQLEMQFQATSDEGKALLAQSMKVVWKAKQACDTADPGEKPGEQAWRSAVLQRRFSLSTRQSC
jgi:hypothetical protein